MILNMTMNARVLSTDSRSLLVRDLSNNMEVRVFYRNARRFSRNDLVRITYTGTMTQSIPPQINALSIQRLPSPMPPSPPVPVPPVPPIPREIRAVIVQRRQNSLLVRDNNNRQIIVSYPYAHHFCPGQQIVIRHDAVTLSNPIEVNATDITPVC